PLLLQSCADFRAAGGEVVVVDTGSTDNTVQLATSSGCKVIQAGDQFSIHLTSEQADTINQTFIANNEQKIAAPNDRVFHFANARNYAASHAKNDFVFHVDASDVLETFDFWRLNTMLTSNTDLTHVSYLL